VRQSGIKSSVIPIHRLVETTPLGLEVRHIVNAGKADFTQMGVHRDDHYIFMIQEAGHSEFIIDFKSFEINGYYLFYIRPGQVHHILASDKFRGWFMAIDTLLVEEKYRTVFEELVLDHRPLPPRSEQEAIQLSACAKLVFDFFSRPEQSSQHYPILHSLVSAYIGMIAEIYQANEPELTQQGSRPEMITRQFRKLLNEGYRVRKNPSQYASALCISLSYLNEVVKAVSGFPVSYWIHHEIILEAKRLLYYSDLNIKEIAFSLGYEDHAYFSRLFTKVTGISAVAFRKHYRE
jgi:AraC family transcriptional activator of pobA